MTPGSSSTTGFILKNLRIAPPKDSAKTPGIDDLRPRFIPRGKAFIGRTSSSSGRLKKRYGTSPRIVTAVLIIESRLGTYPMRYRAMRVFSNMTLVQDQAFVEGLRGHYPGLCELLDDEQTLKTATAKPGGHPASCTSSSSLPMSSGSTPTRSWGRVRGPGTGPVHPVHLQELRRGRNGDGRKDPFSMPDALASIAGFLRKSGWRGRTATRRGTARPCDLQPQRHLREHHPQDLPGALGAGRRDRPVTH